ncbi:MULTISPECIES: hypothetical protein [unclassified Treponema]|uniref:hypothetical protein n=1 Tax=unclassified Treponema TaxID=2638727 RepID=UPI0020A3BF4D|nr:MULTISPECIES: hypothetical protein [unclassified Treponema]
MKNKKIMMVFGIILLSFKLFAYDYGIFFTDDYGRFFKGDYSKFFKGDYAKFFMGDYSSSGFIIVDSETNIAYYSVSRSNTDGVEVVCNVQVNDISKKKNKYIFSDNTTYTVNLVLFEEKIDKKENRKVFHSSHAYGNENSAPHWVKNNSNITGEKISSNIVIKTKNISTKQIEFWLCDKNGNNLQRIYGYNEKETVRFYIDAKRQKIIFIKSVEQGNAITEIDY